jgi:hypothetical protein
MMAETPQTKQGPRDFEDFNDYFENRIKPFILIDLETVFRGTAEYAGKTKRAAVGAGDFILAMSLFAVFDHLGAFLAHWNDELKERESLESKDNIARVAKVLPSTTDIYAIVATLGRNALVHAGWPQTAMPIDDWAFGYSVGGGPDREEEHDMLYLTWHQRGIKKKDRARVKVLKLAQNPHVLYRELKEELTKGKRFTEVSQEAFERVQRYSVVVGVPGKSARDELNNEKQGWKKVLPPRITEQQAKDLQAVAINKRIWDDPELVLYRRTGEVKHVPPQKTEESD